MAAVVAAETLALPNTITRLETREEFLIFVFFTRHYSIHEQFPDEETRWLSESKRKVQE